MKKNPLIQIAGPSFWVNRWLFPAFVLWISFVFLFFFVKLYTGWDSLIPVFPSAGYSPDSTSFVQRLSVWKESFLALASAFLVAGILWSCGKRLLKWFGLQTSQPFQFCLEIGLGIFFLNNLWLGLGLTRLWIGFLWLAGFVLLTLLFLKDLLELTRRGIDFSIPKGLNFWLGFIGVFYLVFLFLHSVLPETFYDSLNYFLGMPSFWLWHHGICDYPTHLLSGYFHAGSLFFLSGFVLTGTEGARVLAALVLIGCALACYGWAGEIAGPRAKAMAFLAVITFPLLYLNSWDVRVDGLLTFILLLFFYCLEKGVSVKKEDAKWITSAGLFAGMALSIKPTAVVGIAAALLALLWRDGFSIVRKKGWLIFGSGIVLGVGPWLIKNFCFAGNPFFPYAISWMGGRQFPVTSYERLLHENRRFLPMDHGILSILNLPWRLTIPGAGDDQFIGPLLLAFLPLLLVFRFKEPRLQFLVRTVFISFVVGLKMSHMLRFSIPAFVLGFLVLSVALTSLKELKWQWAWIGAVAGMALLCIPEYLSISATRYDGWGVWAGWENRRSYIERMTHLNVWAVNNLPKNVRLLVVGDAQVLYYKRRTYANSVFDEQFFAAAARNERDAEGILRRLKNLGITHLRFEDSGSMNAWEYHQYELNKEEWLKIDDFVKRGLEPMGDGLYRLRENLDVKGNHLDNPFSFYPPQAQDWARDSLNKSYEKEKADVDQLLSFFPGDSIWLRQKEQLVKMGFK